MNVKRLLARLGEVIRAAANKHRLHGMLYVAIRNRTRVQPLTVLLESRSGVEFIGNPYYLAKRILEDNSYTGLKVVIVGALKNRLHRDVAFSGSRVRFCKPNSISYAYYLASAAFLVNDEVFPDYFSRREGQQYLNMVRGLPLEAARRPPAVDSLPLLFNRQRNFFQSTHLHSVNQAAETTLLNSFMLRGLWTGSFIRAGNPACCMMRAAAAQIPRSNQVGVNIALFVKWDSTSEDLPRIDAVIRFELPQLLDHLDHALPEDFTVYVWLPAVLRENTKFDSYGRVLPFPQDEEPYIHLARCDALISDPSSVVLDFALTGRPIVVHAFSSTDALAAEALLRLLSSASVVQSNDPLELSVRIVDLVRSNSHGVNSRAIEEYFPWDNGRSTEDLCAEFLRGENRLGGFTPSADENCKTVLIFAGAMLNNGITTSLKSLIQLADLERITPVLWIDADAAEQNAGDYIRGLPSTISYVVSRFRVVIGPIEAIRLLWRELTGRPSDFGDKLDLSVWRREWSRHLGSARVPCLVHFTGYDRRASYLLAVADARKVMYVHNEMADEIHKKGLDARALFAAYDAADTIAVVREGLDEKYNQQFRSIAAKTRYVPNPLILNCRTLSQTDPTKSLAESTPTEDIRLLVRLLQEPGAHRFINVARFSPEKSQERLIDAFEYVWRKHPKCQLIILGGYGPAFNHVRARGRRSDASGRIFIGMGSTNPFPLMACADAFVLSSTYEGRPVVVYEALALGLPVISTDIPGPSEVLRQGHGLVVENSVTGLTEGLLSSVAGNVPQRPYNFVEHNREAMNKFYAVVGA
jgi:CDP-glycerol glycerophosphotransferase